MPPVTTVPAPFKLIVAYGEGSTRKRYHASFCDWKPQPVPAVTAADLDQLWQKLGGAEGLPARRAIAALAGNPRLTLPFLRAQFKGRVGKDGLRPLRLIEVLERIGGEEARNLLAEFVEVGGATLLGREARAVFERLGRR